MWICVICTDPFTKNCSILATDCGHLYHEECLEEWLSFRGNKKQGSCPHCRQLVKSTDCIYLYPQSRDDWNETEPDEKVEMVSGLPERQEERLKRFLEIETDLDPKMSVLTSLIHTLFTVLIACFVMRGLCTYTQFHNYESEEDNVIDEELEDYWKRSHSVVPFGYVWLASIIFCFVASVIFGFWGKYMEQNEVQSFAKYLWVHWAPASLQF